MTGSEVNRQTIIVHFDSTFIRLNIVVCQSSFHLLCNYFCLVVSGVARIQYQGSGEFIQLIKKEPPSQSTSKGAATCNFFQIAQQSPDEQKRSPWPIACCCSLQCLFNLLHFRKAKRAQLSQKFPQGSGHPCTTQLRHCLSC